MMESGRHRLLAQTIGITRQRAGRLSTVALAVCIPAFVLASTVESDRSSAETDADLGDASRTWTASGDRTGHGWEGRVSFLQDQPSSEGTELSQPAPGATPAPSEATPDPRPVVRLTIKNRFNPEDKIFPQVVEGRLISDLSDMETFRMVGMGAPGEYLLTCTIRTLDLESGTNYVVSPDAESNGQPRGRDQITVTMNMDFLLEDAVKEIHRGSLSVQANRDFEISTAHTVSLLSQELVDRAAQRIERMLRKKIPKR